ncbi:phosphatase [Lithospermum erythrorhizon]|uniref:Phosphatase n=1 Tax=Lithospermum erythrorhizon TaxID=34254 RepID=A0AAV3R087_LITER
MEIIFPILIILATSSTFLFNKSSSLIEEKYANDHNYYDFCLSWRLGVEANNIRMWRTVPLQCLHHIQNYYSSSSMMMNNNDIVGGQYENDLKIVMDSIFSYLDNDNIPTNVYGDGYDAWILDVDDTCLSNLFYYKTTRRFGCDPYDPVGFKIWASRGECPAIPAVLKLFYKLIEMGFKVFLITGRDEESLGQATIWNLHTQGFFGYQQLILRNGSYKGQNAVVYKSAIRKQIVKEGYRIWGNVGDQWTDLQGDFTGDRTFKIPNPMYFVP